MKRVIISMLAITLLGSNSLFAGFQGPGATANNDITTVEDAKKLSKDTKVVLSGNIIEKIKNELYVFKDKTGKINVEIDDDKLKDIMVTPETSIILYGEIDNDSDLGGIGIDVDRIKIDNASPSSADAAQANESIQPLSGSEEIASGTDRGCTYTRYSINQSPTDVVNYFEKQFKTNGWKITHKGGSGNSYGGGASLKAEKNGKYGKVDAGGSGANIFFNVWFGSDKKDIDDCRIRD